MVAQQIFILIIWESTKLKKISSTLGSLFGDTLKNQFFSFTMVSINSFCSKMNPIPGGAHFNIRFYQPTKINFYSSLLLKRVNEKMCTFFLDLNLIVLIIKSNYRNWVNLKVFLEERTVHNLIGVNWLLSWLI